MSETLLAAAARKHRQLRPAGQLHFAELPTAAAA